MSSEPRLNLLSFSGPARILHFTWFAFFLSFVVWFNHAPLMVSIRETLGLSAQEVAVLLTLNVALTIPARVIVGMLVDQYGPRVMFSLLLSISGLICFFFAMADSFQALALSRLMLGFVGAGFVIGIRMIGEWFPARQVGLAEGIYGGWGNFGSAAAAMSLPTLALLYGGEEGWRYAVGTTGAIAIIYAFVFYSSVSNTPKGSTYFKPKRAGGLEVTSPGDLLLYLVMNLPMYAALALLTWKLGPANLSLIGSGVTAGIYLTLAGIYLYQAWHIYQINRSVFSEPVPEIHRYAFKQVAILNVAYFVTFGSELAVVSMLPLFFTDTFTISQAQAGLLASGYAFMNLVARPTGGLVSDRFGRRHTLLILLAGLTLGYFILSRVDQTWWIAAAVLATMFCSFFVQAGEGAVFAMVPLIKRRMTGQIAGMTGAYGNVGAVVFLTVLSFVEPRLFFLFIAGCAVVVFVLVALFLDEPSGQMAEILPDGTVQMIDVT
ncbi:MAG: NarK family nitrate/nitrite MFS transporter [Pseudomonadota bacterium]|nr:NarK family nitrate/nitrite MFS transporter [Pseudomonadota bacterium]